MITEQQSKYKNLDQMSVLEIMTNMNNEDKTVPYAIEKQIPNIQKLAEKIIENMKRNPKARLFYLGSGTSGRLGIVDASECPPTFGVDFGVVVGLIAGGDAAIRKAQEFAEDNKELGWKDLQEKNIDKDDVVVGITASGTTPYVIGAVEKCKENGIATGCIVCNSNSKLAKLVDYPIEVIVGPEFLTGSTRMKSGTAQKLVLNMISTSIMLQLGHVKGNKMIDMKLANNKLIDRGTRMVSEELNLQYDVAKKLLLESGNVRKALDAKDQIQQQQNDQKNNGNNNNENKQQGI